MKTFDFGVYIVLYNFMIGILVMLSSDRLGSIAGYLSQTHRVRLARFTSLSTFTFGACVAFIQEPFIWHSMSFGSASDAGSILEIDL